MVSDAHSDNLVLARCPELRVVVIDGKLGGVVSDTCLGRLQVARQSPLARFSLRSAPPHPRPEPKSSSNKSTGANSAIQGGEGGGTG